MGNISDQHHTDAKKKFQYVPRTVAQIQKHIDEAKPAWMRHRDEVRRTRDEKAAAESAGKAADHV